MWSSMLRVSRVARRIPSARLTPVASACRSTAVVLRALETPSRRFPCSIHTSCALFVKGQTVKMPSLSPTMSEGTIVKWYKQEGETINPGDVLCDIQTDKAVVSFEMDDEGILAKIMKPENAKDVKVGTLIALVVEPGEDWKSVEIPTEEGEEVPAATADRPAGSTSSPPSSSAPAGGDSSHAAGPMGPAVRNLLQMYNLAAGDVKPCGPGGRLTKGDVLEHVKAAGLKPAPVAEVAPPAAPAPAPASTSSQTAPAVSTPSAPGTSPYVDIPLTSMRATIAKRLTESKSGIPHAYATVEADITKLMSERKRLKGLGIGVSVNDFVIKAVAEALMRCPNVNITNNNGQIKWSPSVDISVAVATDQGLITPIVPHASKKSLETISTEVRDLAKRAKENKLKLNEFQGGSFTISNLGMFGILEFTAIINPPQCAILAVGGGSSVLGADGKFRQMMRSSLSYDARAISETDAAEFLEIFQTCLETPELLLRGSAGSTRHKRLEAYMN